MSINFKIALLSAANRMLLNCIFGIRVEIQ